MVKQLIRKITPRRTYDFAAHIKYRLRLAKRVTACKMRYVAQVKRIRQKAVRGEKIRVLFIVSEIAKWKEQKLYEAMARSKEFEPVVGISAWNAQSESLCPNDELLKVHARAEEFFDKLGDKHVRTVCVVDGKRVISDLMEFSPDIVYYTEGWGPCGEQDSKHVSHFALTCYSPYYVPNYGVISQECHLDVHVFLWRYFCLGRFWSRFLEDSFDLFDHVVKFIPAGHPALDFFSMQKDRKPKGNCIVYAPHCSVPHPKCDYFPQYYGTFDWNGMAILAYAKQHPEIQWVFKPHPLLRTIMTGKLTKGDGLMTSEEVDDYYAEWAKIGTVCTDGDYQDLFLDSRVLITDCGSFLTEYGATGRPVIHLICAKNCRKPVPPSKMVYDTYYQVHNLDEMYATFKTVIEDAQDPKKEERLAAVKEAGIADVNASENIVNYLRKELCRK